MAALNPNNLSKDELRTFMTKRCTHSHFYFEHPSCFLKEKSKPIKRGFFDIETGNLKANFGILLSYAIKVENEDVIYSDTITKKDLNKKILDKRLLQECIDDLSKFDEILTYYGTRFDIPFVRSRALYWGLEFPKYGFIKHKDIYYMVRNRLCLSSNHLETACRFLGIKEKTHIDNEAWILATCTGDKKALEEMSDHNRKDSMITEHLYHKICDYVKETKRSI